MKAYAHNQMFDTEHHSPQFDFALVIGGVGHLRSSVIALLRGHGWLVHGVSRPEQAFGVLAHIPYSLIILDSELPGMCATDFVPLLRRLKKCQAARLVVINDSKSANLDSPIAECDAFLARRSMWEDDLVGFLVPKEQRVLGASAIQQAL